MSEAATDRKFMEIALEEAVIAANTGNYPVGGVLVIGGKIIGKDHNHKEQTADSISHAEALLFLKHSSELRKFKHSPDVEKVLYTTLEPCLMCFGMAVIHRLDRIVVACKDPRGDMSTIDPEKIGQWYVRNWPHIEYGPLAKDPHQLLSDFFGSRTGEEAAEARGLLEEMKNSL
jgi:tRNA(adenine34) deaminase